MLLHQSRHKGGTVVQKKKTEDTHLAAETSREHKNKSKKKKGKVVVGMEIKEEMRDVVWTKMKAVIFAELYQDEKRLSKAEAKK